MYGQKQILQCLAVALILAVFSFHRTAIQRNKANAKPKLRIKSEYRPKIEEVDTNVERFKHNSTGYCIRYPFGENEYGLYEPIVFCRHICFDTFGTWLQKQSRANCCINKTNAITLKRHLRKFTSEQLQKPHKNGENALQRSEKNVDNGASLPNKQCEGVKTIIGPPLLSINEILLSNNPSDVYECKIQMQNEFICKNTTSGTVDIVKLETNKTNKIMDYHDFLFNTGTNERKPASHAAHSHFLERKFFWHFFSF